LASARAGGQWAVSVVEFKGKEQELGDILRASYMKFKNSIGQGFGVSERPNYTATRSHDLDVVLQLAPVSFPSRSRYRECPSKDTPNPALNIRPDEAWANRSASWLSPLPTTSSSG
jgi:D-amino-acid oxidase